MADIKSTHSDDSHTRQVTTFPEVTGKIIESVELSSAPDYYEFTFRFQDRTALTFILEPCLITFPVLADWTGGEEKTLKRYKSVRSKVPRT